jgi:hypothetical protein
MNKQEAIEKYGPDVVELLTCGNCKHIRHGHVMMGCIVFAESALDGEPTRSDLPACEYWDGAS